MQAGALLSAEQEESSEEGRNEKAPSTNTSEDLSQIKGIGPSFVKRLNAAGIHGITQIAALDEGGVKDLETSLKCKGRITREEWVKQAQQLLGR